MIEAKKISFHESWDSSIIFFVDEELEQEIELQVESLLKTARDQNLSEVSPESGEFSGSTKRCVGCCSEKSGAIAGEIHAHCFFAQKIGPYSWWI